MLSLLMDTLITAVGIPPGIINGYSFDVNYGTVVRMGNTSYNREVYVAQSALNWIDNYNSGANCNVGSQDGIFGSGTYNGVVAFQGFWNRVKASSESYYIDVDGIVGNCTWACLTVYA